MSRFKGSQQESAELFEKIAMENISISPEEPEPDTEPVPEPEPSPEPSPFPEPVPEEVPGRQLPGREVEEPDGPWVKNPTVTPDQTEQPSYPTEVPRG